MAEYKLGYTGAQINAAIGRVLDGVPFNLLDNCDFRNPVNQRGAETANAYSYFIDRWCTGGKAVSFTLSQNGITINNQIRQYIEFNRIAGKIITLAAKIDGNIYCCSGTIPSTYSGSWTVYATTAISKGKIFIASDSAEKAQIRIDGTSDTEILVEWIALYEGSYTADTLPTYQPKGYAVELAECMRYYQIIPEQTSCAFSTSAQSNKYFSSSINFPQMRIAPTVTLKTDSNGNIGVVHGVAFVSPSEFDFAYKLNGTLLPATTNANYAGKVMSFYGIELSADL